MKRVIHSMLVATLCVQALAKMTPSDMSMAMFRSARITEPTVFRAKLKIAAWDSISYQQRGPMDQLRKQFLAVRVNPYNSRDEQSSATHICYVKKSSEAGRIVAEELKDGGIHGALVSLRYSPKPDFEGVCVLDEIEMLDADRSDEISVKFTGTRISLVKGKACDILQGSIKARIKSDLKFFKRPVLRVVVLTEENGSRVVRDSIMDEPNIKVLNGSDTLLRHTTTDGNDENEPSSFMRHIDEISNNQSEVSSDIFSNVTYVGLPMDTRLKKTIKGTLREQHIFGYVKFDKDERAKMIGYRIEMWYCGECIESYDTIKKSHLKRHALPEDWHVSFLHPDKFKYRSPYSRKTAVTY